MSYIRGNQAAAITGSTLAERLAYYTIPEALTGCHLCWASNDDKGYAHFQMRGKTYKAHRIAWEIANARPIPDGMAILHRCDTPACVNPLHLRAGTQKENAADRESRRRGNQPIGLKNGRARWSQEIVDAVRAAYVPLSLAQRRRQMPEICQRFGMKPGYVKVLASGQRRTKRADAYASDRANARMLDRLPKGSRIECVKLRKD